MTTTATLLLIFIGLFQLVSMVVLWRCLPEIESMLTRLVGEMVRMRQLSEDTAKTSAQAAATWAEVKRKMLRGETGN